MNNSRMTCAHFSTKKCDYMKWNHRLNEMIREEIELMYYYNLHGDKQALWQSLMQCGALLTSPSQEDPCLQPEDWDHEFGLSCLETVIESPTSGMQEVFNSWQLKLGAYHRDDVPSYYFEQIRKPTFSDLRQYNIQQGTPDADDGLGWWYQLQPGILALLVHYQTWGS